MLEYLSLVITVVISFSLGIIFSDKLKEEIIYKLWSPINISSNHPIYYAKTPISVNKNFYDEFIIINNSKKTIKINKINVTVQINKKYGEKGIFMRYIWSNRKELSKIMEVNGEEMIGGLMWGPNTIPIVLEPNKSKKLCLGISCELRGGEKVETTITISPEYNYKRTKLKYLVIFKK